MDGTCLELETGLGAWNEVVLRWIVIEARPNVNLPRKIPVHNMTCKHERISTEREREREREIEREREREKKKLCVN